MQIMQGGSGYEGPGGGLHPKESHRRGKGRWFWATVILVTAALVVGVALIQAQWHKPARSIPLLPAPGSATNIAAPSPVELSVSFREVSKAIKPSVVFISVGGVEGDIPMPRGRSGAGSGFIVTPDGYVLTNNHVIRGANEINVTLADGRRFKAELIGADRETDLAVIKIDSDSLPIAVLGDSDQVEQGDWVLALGSPFGLQQTLTAGIVSATGREVGDSQFNRYIQTDAAINPGNSGGPLVSMQGEVVGINTLIFTTGAGFSQGNIGIGFAINSNVAREVFNQLVRSGKVTRGFLGVQVQPLDEARASLVGLEPGAGVFIEDVIGTDSPAAKAGLQSRDVITAFNGKPVKAPRELTNAVAATPVGSTVQVDFIRGGQPQSVSVAIAERPQAAIARAPQPEFDLPLPGVPEEGEQGARQGRLGIQGQSVTLDLAERMKLKSQDGVLVMSVRPGSPASEAGIAHGDVIHSVGNLRVKTIEELIGALQAAPAGDDVLLEVERGGRTIYLNVTLQ